MARLYPPSIAGTIPSFYEKNGTVIVTVPFSLNKVVPVAAVSHCRLKIKRTDTDTMLGTIDSSPDTWAGKDVSALALNFTLNENITRKLIVGTSYKIQIAYIDTYGGEGYYSSVAIGKFTAQPEVTIANFDSTRINSAQTIYVGQYANIKDTTEKVYQYCFNLYDFNNILVESSDWKIHNTYNDTESDRSIDQYIFKHVIESEQTYKVEYCIKTGGGLEIHSPKYLIAAETIVPSEFQGSIKAELNYDKGAVEIQIIPEKDEYDQEVSETGTFVITRRSSKNNFATAIKMFGFSVLGEVPKGTLFTDYTVESGVSYKYAIQQQNENNIRSTPIETSEIKVYYEDAFLYDGHRQLKIRFNPKVSSFKSVVMESKKNTIGNKYPYFFRNGIVNYKEFPISGLISYLMDNDSCFYTKEELGFAGQEDSFDHTDENIALEKCFKLKVLDWLNNGEIKLFKSPQEGNYVVMLQGVSLTPTDQLGRMLHTFNCTADEIAEFSDSSLAEYNFVDIKDIKLERMRYTTINFQDWINEQLAKPNVTLLSLANKNMINTDSLSHIKITNALPGTIVRIGESQTIVIGATGQYEAIFEEPPFGFALLSPSRIMPGEITYGTMTAVATQFDLVKMVDIMDVPMLQSFGPNNDLLKDFQDLKHEVAQIYFLRFTRLEQQVVEHFDELNIAECSPYYLYTDKNTSQTYAIQNGEWILVPDIYESYNIHFGNNPDGTPNILNVQEAESLSFYYGVDIPDQIEIGAGVCAELSLRIKIIHFTVEDKVVEQKQAYENAKRDYSAACLDYQIANRNEIGSIPDIVYYYWNQEYFVRINESDYERYKANTAPQVYRTRTFADTSEQPSPELIQLLYNNLEDAKEEFFNAIEASIEEVQVR